MVVVYHLRSKACSMHYAETGVMLAEGKSLLDGAHGSSGQ